MESIVPIISGFFLIYICYYIGFIDDDTNTLTHTLLSANDNTSLWNVSKGEVESYKKSEIFNKTFDSIDEQHRI